MVNKRKSPPRNNFKDFRPINIDLKATAESKDFWAHSMFNSSPNNLEKSNVKGKKSVARQPRTTKNAKPASMSVFGESNILAESKPKARVVYDKVYESNIVRYKNMNETTIA